MSAADRLYEAVSRCRQRSDLRDATELANSLVGAIERGRLTQAGLRLDAIQHIQRRRMEDGLDDDPDLVSVLTWGHMALSEAHRTASLTHSRRSFGARHASSSRSR